MHVYIHIVYLHHYMYICMSMYVYIHVYIHVYMYTYIHMCIYIYIYTYMYIYTYTYTCLHIYIWYVCIFGIYIYTLLYIITNLCSKPLMFFNFPGFHRFFSGFSARRVVRNVACDSLRQLLSESPWKLWEEWGRRELGGKVYLDGNIGENIMAINRDVILLHFRDIQYK